MIIPAAGFGLRVGRPAAKELLPDSSGEPLILWWLQRAAEIEANVHLITRYEKQVLVDFVSQACEKMNLNFSVQRIESSKEWPDTVLQSEKFWSEKNILVLPDTRFEPVRILKEISSALESFEIVTAVFSVENPELWGMTRQSQHHQFEICDKPARTPEGALAWGLLGFQKQAGALLFQSILDSYFDKKWKLISKKNLSLGLEKFEDLTR
jgi:dTDP-glucose pyrophosphorylase